MFEQFIANLFLSSCASAPQVDTERCALTFAPENEDPDQIGTGRTWRKSAIRRRDCDSPGKIKNNAAHRHLISFFFLFWKVCILCISNLPKGKTKAFYEEFLQNYTTDLDDADDAFDSEKEKVQGHLGPIFPQYGSVFLSFWSKKAAFLSYRLLQEEMTDLRVDVLPNINSRYLKI